MKEHPILFSAPMVRAILDGRKTQTRRIWKLPKWAEWDLMDEGEAAGSLIPKNPKHKGWYSVDEVDCPYGQPSEQLWVRETFGIGYEDGVGGYSALPWTGAVEQRDGKVFYRVDFNEKLDEPRRPWRPSIHMPRWASRISLEITSIRVERLQDINEVDAKAEGADCLMTADCTAQDRALLDLPLYEDANPYRNGYALLWEAINGTGSWDANPWVWVIEFKRIGQ